MPILEPSMLISGLAGQLEIMVTEVDHANTAAIICHPHPLYGGTMRNKVVTTLMQVFRDLNMPTVRFNFRGVGKSSGSFADGVGETEDLLAVVEWAKSHFKVNNIWLAGFSFGGYIAARATETVRPELLITVAPQASRFTAEKMPIISCPWIIVQGEQDEVVPPSEVYALVDALQPKPILIRIPNAGHFFHGQLVELKNKIGETISQV